MRASRCSMAGMPSASQMQLAHQRRLPTCTGKEVGTAENGAARQSSPVSCRTKACVSAKRFSPARTCRMGAESAAAISLTRGARP